MRVCFADGYFAQLPAGHRFPMGKFTALHQILLEEGLVDPSDVVAPEEAEWQDLQLVHTPEYLTHLKDGTLDRASERRMGLPWSAALVRRSRLATSGTIAASRMALVDGAAANLAGGMHHGYPDYGEGFCVLNDVAVAARRLLADGAIARILLIDLDVHQGNGNAAIFADEPAVYTSAT
jgi:acetoin utilization deacetylase AcuC-like enzyme